MSQTRTEIIVGFFVLVGLACLGYLAIKLGKLEVLGSSGYIVYADFSSATNSSCSHQGHPIKSFHLAEGFEKLNHHPILRT